MRVKTIENYYHDAIQNTKRTCCSSQLVPYLTVICMSTLIVASAFLAIANGEMLLTPLSHMKAELEKSSTSLDCGNSTADAKAKGCIYDLMASGWLPPSCYQQQLSERYLATDKWKFYTEDGGQGTQLSYEMAKQGQFDAMYVSNGFHIAHCLYGWERYSAARKNNLPIDRQAKALHHATHCSDFILQYPNHNSINTSIVSSYFTCERP